jgi:hypothetical protein
MAKKVDQKDRQFRAADQQIEKAAVAISRALDGLLARTARLESVAQDVVVERMLLRLIDDLARFVGENHVAGPATLQLVNASGA